MPWTRTEPQTFDLPRAGTVPFDFPTIDYSEPQSYPEAHSQQYRRELMEF